MCDTWIIVAEYMCRHLDEETSKKQASKVLFSVVLEVDVDVETETCSIGPIMHHTIVFVKAMYLGSNESMLVKYK